MSRRTTDIHPANRKLTEAKKASVRHAGNTRQSMPVTRPRAVDPYLESIVGPGEQFVGDPESHCINPKCDFRMDPDAEEEVERTGQFTCPNCGTNNAVDAEAFAPGGRTRAGLTLDQMGQIGESLIARIGEIPGIGAVVQTIPSNRQKGVNPEGEPVDAIVAGSDGTRYGCEIKCNHAQAQERFKIGGQKERLSKLQYCAANGLKPALIGVRLNFFTDKALVFWRPGLTDTWISNKQMAHVGTFDFSDLNPFQAPNPATKQREIEDAALPDQSLGEDESGGVFAATKVAEQPRLEDGRFTFKDHVHEVKVVDKKGKHKSSVKRCKSCGTLYEKPAEHRGRFECPTCGEDPERKLVLTKVIISAPVEQPLDLSAWSHDGVSADGHRRFSWQDPSGFNHLVFGNSGRKKVEMDQAHTQQRMRACMLGKCNHARNAHPTMAVEAEPSQGVWRPGDQVNLNGEQGLVVEIEGSIALVQNLATGQEDVIPTAQLTRAAAKNPNFLYVYYMSGLKIEKWHHNLKYDQMLEDLLRKNGYEHVPHDLDPNEVDAGEVFEYEDGSLKIEHKQLARPEVREQAEKQIGQWLDDKGEVLPEAEEEMKDDQSSETADVDDDDADDEDSKDVSEHWRHLPRDDEGQWQAL